MSFALLIIEYLAPARVENYRGTTRQPPYMIPRGKFRKADKAEPLVLMLHFCPVGTIPNNPPYSIELYCTYVQHSVDSSPRTALNHVV